MFKVTPKGINRLDIEMSGKLSSEEMKAALDELVSKSKHIENGRMLYDVVDYHLPSLGAIVIEFARLPEMLRWMRRFKRAAVLADKRWLKKASELEGALLPGLEIKAFDRDQKEAAESWLEHYDNFGGRVRARPRRPHAGTDAADHRFERVHQPPKQKQALKRREEWPPLPPRQQSAC